MEDDAFTARIKSAWQEVRAFWEASSDANHVEAEDPQWKYASEFFDYYVKHPHTSSGQEGLITAFTMWGNVKGVNQIKEAIKHIDPTSEVWSQILINIGNAFGRTPQEITELRDLRKRLETTLTHPKSRSELLLIMAESDAYNGDIEEARRRYEEVIQLNADPFRVTKAKGALYEIDALNVGQSAPDFSATDLDGQRIALSVLRGKVVLLAFWSTTCGPCKPEIPHLQRLHQDLDPALFRLIGITDDQNLEQLKRFINERDMAWPQIRQEMTWVDGDLQLGEIFKKYNVYGIPMSFVIDPTGFIAAKGLRGEELEERVRQLVAAAA